MLLERLVAGVLVIGLLLWGASILATPSLPSDGEGAPDAPARILPGLDEPAAPASASRPPPEKGDGKEDEDDDEEEDDERDREEKRKGKRKGKGASG